MPGRRYDDAKAGRIFTGSSAATGIVLPIFSATAQVFGLWNPVNSGVTCEMISVRGTYVDTTGAAGGFTWGLLRNCGMSVATAAPISAFTETVPEKSIMGTAGAANRVRFTGSAATVTTALMVVGRQLGVNELVLTATDATNGLLHFKDDYDGEFNVAPGHAIFLCGNIATLSKWAVSVVWAEQPA
jgi:hypothetical protein